MQTESTRVKPRLGIDSRAGIDPRCVPIKLTQAMPEGGAIPLRQYSAEENETWKALYARQRALLEGRACQEFLDGLEIMDFPADRVPSLRDVHGKLKATTGWSIALAPGLLA